jgi:hypothetical protein
MLARRHRKQARKTRTQVPRVLQKVDLRELQVRVAVSVVVAILM